MTLFDPIEQLILLQAFRVLQEANAVIRRNVILDRVEFTLEWSRSRHP
jgi:hypothetical protein